MGSVNEIGRNFGVFKLVRGEVDCDISIPRKDSQTGTSHKDIIVEGDPFMGIEAAARRRDLTINAIALDPLTGEIADPFGGAKDIAAKRLNAVDPVTFAEDPLRALRVVQFSARFEFSISKQLSDLCTHANLQALPPERVWGELEKLLLMAPKPGRGWALLEQFKIIEKRLPELQALPIDPVITALNRAAIQRTKVSGLGRKLVLMLAVALHRADEAQATATLDRLNVHRSHNTPVRARVLEMLEHWATLSAAADDTTLRKLAEKTEVMLLAEVASAITDTDAPAKNLNRASQLGVATTPLPTLVHGRDLSTLGVEPGPEMGKLLRRVREAQLRGEFSDKASALHWLAHEPK
jgi:tRNA nucleotidyltransferase (CCA-adding enzyme)